ncbi:hypothetical protein CAEBREN_13095 [Caenorhabditis brenneri]|uniref:F-box domain-containing protein n=1 Tax=Caenorhabditis brenneri TaxID=135651 RepID=G0NS21_CAEBE|nr:hypothetical protein CAEBREN_13095 [Caenorhabditis brenneri]
MVNVQRTFPLFRLPTLAYENVIDILDLKEKFDLSATSKKSSFVVKRYNRIKKHNLVIFLRCDNNPARIYVYIDRGNKSHVCNCNSWVFDLGDANNVIVDPTITQITHIASVAPTASLRLQFGEMPLERAFIPLAQRLNLTLKSVEKYFIGDGPDDELCRWVFENCRHAQRLIYHFENSIGFTMEPETMGSYSFEVLDISEANWVTGIHLTHCFTNCKNVEFMSANLTDQEMNDYLKHWIEEGSKNQKFFITDNRPFFERADIFVGITYVSYPYVHDKTLDKIAKPGFVIKNTEGLEAVVHLTDDSFHLTTDFEIVDENFRDEDSSDDEYFDDDEEEVSDDDEEENSDDDEEEDFDEED